MIHYDLIHMQMLLFMFYLVKWTKYFMWYFNVYVNFKLWNEIPEKYTNDHFEMNDNVKNWLNEMKSVWKIKKIII